MSDTIIEPNKKRRGSKPSEPDKKESYATHGQSGDSAEMNDSADQQKNTFDFSDAEWSEIQRVVKDRRI